MGLAAISIAEVGEGISSELSGAPGGPTVVPAVGDIGACVTEGGFFVGGMGVCFCFFASLYFSSASTRSSSGSTHFEESNFPCLTFCLTLPI